MEATIKTNENDEHFMVMDFHDGDELEKILSAPEERIRWVVCGDGQAMILVVDKNIELGYN